MGVSILKDKKITNSQALAVKLLPHETSDVMLFNNIFLFDIEF